jgi:hypothetical protein
MALTLPSLEAKELFVAPNGDDSAPGTLEKPLAGLQKAQELASPGDTVWIRGGTYKIPANHPIAHQERIWVYLYYFNKSGTAEAPIRYWAYQDEHPVFDFSAVKPADIRINAFQVMGSYLHFRGFEVVGVQVNFKGHGQSCSVENHGSHNIFERLSLHDSQAIGIYALSGAHNLFLNCDAYNNYDYTSEDHRGGNVDGFGCHPTRGSIDNVFRGCRAWFNSDDGYDCINAQEVVIFEQCWAMYNGYGTKFEKLGDGNGFKAGGYGATPIERLPKVVPRHIVRGCLAVRNKASGFYANHHIGGGDWFYNSATGNSNNFNFLERTPDNAKDIDGAGHVIMNNLAFKGRLVTHLADDISGKPNTFGLGLKLTEDDFVNVNEALLVGPRNADGSLPKTGFLQPKSPEKLGNFGYTAYPTTK